jgi:hypothetical protein
MTEPFPDRIPLVIGVTGHRDLRGDDVPQLKDEVKKVILRLRHDYLGDDTETPVVILSSLAEGGDRLVAQVALTLGARLVAPLPMPVDEYRRDFEPGLAPGNAAEFDALLAQAIAAPVMPFTPGNSLEVVRADKAKRDEQYRALALFIVQHCHALIALWDGKEENMSPGGTAEVVAFKRHGIPLTVSGSARASLDASEIGPVVHIVTPRKKSEARDLKISVHPWGHRHVKRVRRAQSRRPRADHWVAPTPDDQDAEAWAAFATLAKLSRQFNHEAAKLDRTAQRVGERNQRDGQLFADWKLEQTVDPAAHARAMEIAPRWCRQFGVADTLAQRRREVFQTDWRGLFALGLFALFCFEIESHLLFDWPFSYWLLLGYIGIFFVVFLWFAWARWREHQERFLDYRALAESLRVAVFWKLVGASGPKSETGLHSIAEAYPIKQTSELAWVKLCLRTLELLDRSGPPPEATSDLDPVAYGWARNLWVGGQLDFFFRRGRDHNEKAERHERISSGLLGFSILFALLLFSYIHFHSPHPEHDAWSYRGAIFIIGMLPGFAAALVGYTEQMAFKAQARQYDRMRTLFERAYELLPATSAGVAPEHARAVFSELGCEAMKENAEWVAIYRQRPIRSPQG